MSPTALSSPQDRTWRGVFDEKNVGKGQSLLLGVHYGERMQCLQNLEKCLFANRVVQLILETERAKSRTNSGIYTRPGRPTNETDSSARTERTERDESNHPHTLGRSMGS